MKKLFYYIKKFVELWNEYKERLELVKKYSSINECNNRINELKIYIK